ncbi:hypothetical protein CEXT_311551 [Caerostris extrusa]|uniref:Uncharacterized protein n=1 Tax=Caerostris extrusa TaxID=172846 RepID=A0AAV4NIT3_CAEEX|nr:hypothetical protein CEXT_311551 [Caerostris extrusa]
MIVSEMRPLSKLFVCAKFRLPDHLVRSGKCCTEFEAVFKQDLLMQEFETFAEGHAAGTGSLNVPFMSERMVLRLLRMFALRWIGNILAL